MLQCIDLIVLGRFIDIYMIRSCTKAMGIDISKTSVKAVCVDEKGIMDGYGIDDLPANAGDTEVILSLKKVLSQDCYNCDVVIGLRGLDVLTKNASFSNIKNLEDMGQAVEAEIEQLLPVDRSEVQVSWEVIKQDTEKVEAILIAVPNKVIERYKRLVDGVGLNIKSLEINALALKRSFSAEMKEKSMIVDVHADETDIEFYDREVLVLDKTIPMGGMSITRSISKSLNISMEEAEAKKRESKIVDNKVFNEIYKKSVDELILEIIKTMSMAEIEYHIKPDEILLTGGDFNTQTVADYVIENLSQLSIARLVVPRAVLMSNNIDKDLGDKLRLGNALGLALK